MPKIAIGTAQFGMNYGISNCHGQISEQEAKEILAFAQKEGIDLIDTAAVYGNSEQTIGTVLRADNAIKIVTKTAGNSKDEILFSFNRSLERLKVRKVYGLLFHCFNEVKEGSSKWDLLRSLKDKAVVDRIGVSLYHPEEWQFLLENNIIPDIVQVPFNLFDQRFKKILPEMKARGVEIHVRSVFLQGLLLMEPEKLDPFFSPIKHNLSILRNEVIRLGCSIQQICLGYVDAYDEIDYIVIGVERLENLIENLMLLKNSKLSNSEIKKVGTGFSINDERMVLPYLWPKK